MTATLPAAATPYRASMSRRTNSEHVITREARATLRGTSTRSASRRAAGNDAGRCRKLRSWTVTTSGRRQPSGPAYCTCRQSTRSRAGRAPERQRDAQDAGPLAHADRPRAGPRRQPAVEGVGGVRREEREGLVALLRVQRRDQVSGIGGIPLAVGLGTVRINADPDRRLSQGRSIDETGADGNLVDPAAALGDLVPPRWIGHGQYHKTSAATCQNLSWGSRR